MIVYALIDPMENVVRYVGISRHPAKYRFAVHIKDAKTRYRKGLYLSHKEQWLMSLNQRNLMPIILTLWADLNEEDAVLYESILIKTYGRTYEGGTLFNVHKGGAYDSCKAHVWNKGVKDCYNDQQRNNNRQHQPNKKAIYRFNQQGVLIDIWDSLRHMCAELHLDRRTVMRCLKQEPNFLSHKKYMFSYTDTPPVYVNRSTLLQYDKSPHAKRVTACKDGKQYVFNSIREASDTLNVPAQDISAVLHHKQRTAKCYTFKFTQ